MEFLSVPLPEKIVSYESEGAFEKATREIDFQLSLSLPSMLRERLLWERERLRRIRDNYIFTVDRAFEILDSELSDFTRGEFDELKKGGYLDFMVIDGEEFYEKRFDKNLLFARNEYEKRLKEKDTDRDKKKELLQTQIDRLISERVPATFRIRARSSINARVPVGDKGEYLKCWLPIARPGDQVANVKILGTSQKKYFLAPSDAPQRTIYMEAPVGEVNFSVEFEYEISEISTSIDPFSIRPVDTARFHNYLCEQAPHILFTPFLKNLASEIAGNERNPYYIAKSFYDWICDNIRYSFMSEYALYGNLSEFAASNMRGDCGLKALLFMTLCRIKGIPSRWQSGWYATPVGASPHDWAFFWIEPYGWVPVDGSFGGARKDIPAYREFYFGNLDAYRMVANSAFMAPLTPSKRFYRFDPYDNQTGEIETNLRPIRSGEKEHALEILDFERI